MKVLLFRGKGFLSQLIRWQTRSEYSHAALLLADGETIIEAWPGKGVQTKKVEDWSNVTPLAIAGITGDGAARALEFAQAQVGKGYDYWSVLRFVSRRHMPANDKWFCSELVFEALRQAGIPLLSRVDASDVSPEMLSLSTRLLG